MSAEPTLADSSYDDARQCRVVVDPFRCMNNREHDGQCVSENYLEQAVPMGVWPEHREHLAHMEAAAAAAGGAPGPEGETT